MSRIQKFSYFEALLGVVGLFLIYIYPGSEIPDWSLTSEILIQSSLYLAPTLVLALLFSLNSAGKIKAFDEIQKKVKEFASTFLWDSHWLQILFLSVCAGFGEEILFRGYLQTEFNIHVASIVFGVLHSVTLAYFFIATLMGYYLGFVFETTGSLWTVIFIHSIYDFVALMLLKRKFKPVNSPTQSD